MEKISIKIKNRLKKEISDVAKRTRLPFVKNEPVYIFHHIPKCGGTSLNNVLNNSFLTIKDYRKGWWKSYPRKVNLKRLRSCHCLCGHFETDGYYLYQRYPEVFISDRYKVFTFVRNPLDIQLSLYRYEKMHNQTVVQSIEEHLLLRPNYLANRFPATIDNYKEVLSRYFFIGVLEESEKSLAVLSQMMGTHLVPLPKLNQSTKKTSSQTESLSHNVIAQFKEANALDFLIYDYCVEQLNKFLSRT